MSSSDGFTTLWLKVLVNFGGNDVDHVYSRRQWFERLLGRLECDKRTGKVRRLPIIVPDRYDAAGRSMGRRFPQGAKKTPIQRIREEILKRHHLTEAEFAALPTEEQAKILREIEEAVKAALKKQLSKSDPGLVV